jgi:hypothetical protein
LLPPTDNDLTVFPLSSELAPAVLSAVNSGCNDDNVLCRFVMPDIVLLPLINTVLLETFNVTFVPPVIDLTLLLLINFKLVVSFPNTVNVGCNDDNVLAKFVMPDIVLLPLRNIVLLVVLILIFVPPVIALILFLLLRIL